MRPLYVPVRLAVTVMAVAAVAGCMSVGNDEGGRVQPSHSAGKHGGDAPDGGSAGAGGGFGMGAAGGDGKHGHGKGDGAKASASASATAAPSAGASASASAGAVKPGHTDKPGAPTPTRAQPTAPTRSPDPEPPAPSPEPPSPTPEPTVAEPSASAHEDGGGTTPQLAEREPAPEAAPEAGLPGEGGGREWRRGRGLTRA
ncbi:hypothetical protein SAMN04487983_10622 [Streptomyces sp. yr375]|uniref:hypothetical protein n=1 Tax=Streptomyces sp. yr375 TaxID=1761906 RepID=UPI0008AEB5BA|nr:hypothetical protein [Streptomyces sp. yr375]SES46906.1 hypothetical protein SAMN04487983_10622 [Streptomyces sp. yr375]